MSLLLSVAAWSLHTAAPDAHLPTCTMNIGEEQVDQKAVPLDCVDDARQQQSRAARQALALQRGQMAQLLNKLEQQIRHLVEQLAVREAQIKRHAQTLVERQEQLEEQAKRQQQQRERLEQREQLCSQQLANAGQEQQAAVDRLHEQLDRLEQMLAGGPSAAGQGPQQARGSALQPHAEEVDDLRQRLQMALDELRELKAENAQLHEQLSASPPAASTGSSAGQTLDWETQKQQLLAQLEADGDWQEPQQQQERQKLQEAIRTTERIVAEKDREIQELRRLLEEQSGRIADVAVGANAIGQMLDQDELIRQERENLRAMQEEWREKLRQAEIEISTERAKLARERNALEEQLLMLQKAQGQAAGAKQQKSQPARGRWLARLGLVDPDS